MAKVMNDPQTFTMPIMMTEGQWDELDRLSFEKGTTVQNIASKFLAQAIDAAMRQRRGRQAAELDLELPEGNATVAVESETLVSVGPPVHRDLQDILNPGCEVSGTVEMMIGGALFVTEVTHAFGGWNVPQGET